MEQVEIRRNAKLQRDAEGLYWLLIDSSAGQAMFALSIFNVNAETNETKNIGFDDVLEAFMKDQLTATQH